jgi:hyaluronoglucosaminidase
MYSGFVSNPMDKPEASKIGLFGVADYCWNPKAFNSKQNWEDCFPRLFPYIAQAVRTFAEHNSDQGPNGHGYRREESVSVAENVKTLTAAIREGKPLPEADYNRLLAEFRAIRAAGDTILKDCKNPLFLEDVTNWCQVFEAFGAMGEAAMLSLAGKLPPEEAVNTILAEATS